MANYNITADSTLVAINGDFPTADANPYALPPAITKTADAYMGLITPWQANSVKARFLATVRANVQPQADVQAFVAGLPQAFDVDEAIGVQLDIDGQWIGRDRYVPIPLPDTTFALGIEGRGLGQGYWRTNYDGENAISSLPDSLYRPLLYAKILANRWDGTATMAVQIVRTYLTDPSTIVFANDGARAIVPHQGDVIFSLGVPGAGLGQGRWLGKMEYPATPKRVGMAYSICISGKLPSRTDLYILANDLLPVKAMGVDARISVTSTDGAPVFGLGMNNSQIGGLGVGAWGRDPATVAATLVA
ncbi:DUF2612 domain-containing protein [Methylobacterium sp. P1-11]|uniref:DUF2612 domain-containing protein n=1 Tax=Methylobacterium sp. P1-11 TaxID=2024616 RepID=UPI0011ED4A08|nr:DUF2612 domain-containing protein [Methylobacterium sp. P1-11]KAA0117892.1 DUF2612 domain-containing protein [Methylobacterium sp. P1-11]